MPENERTIADIASRLQAVELRRGVGAWPSASVPGRQLIGAGGDRANDSLGQGATVAGDSSEDRRGRAPTILVVDDDEDVRQFLRAMLMLAGYDVIAADDGAKAVAVAEQENPDVIVLDLSLPDMSGLDVCSALRRWFRGPILILSGYGEESLVIEALDRGSDDYLTKPLRRGELLARLRALLRRTEEARQASPVLVAGDIVIDVPQRSVTVQGRSIRLNRMEFNVLAYLAENQDRVVPSETLIEHVWGRSRGECMETLRVHIGRIRKKLGQHQTTAASLTTEPGVGYRLVSRADDHLES